MKKKFMYALVWLGLFGCTSHNFPVEGSAQKSNLTMGVVKSQLQKGKTTQEEVLKLFGAPNLVSKNKSNYEVWSYNKMSVENKAGSTDYFVGKKASQSSSSRSFDLMITFDSQDIILDYSVISTSF